MQLAMKNEEIVISDRVFSLASLALSFSSFLVHLIHWETVGLDGVKIIGWTSKAWLWFWFGNNLLPG